MRGAPLALALAVMAAVAACADEDPVSVNGDLIPLTPQTVEVILPWSEFGAEVEILGGFGTPSQLPGQVVSLDYRGELDSRALVRFFPFPASASVRDSTGTTRVDSAFTWLSGRVVARVDTLRTQVTGPVEMSLSRLDQDWHFRSATWDLLVDTVQDQRTWGEPGAGPGVSLGTAIWDPAQGDSVVFPLDSATVALFGDTTGVRTTARLDVATPGVLLQLADVDLRLDARPSINQDTVIVLNSGLRQGTFVYSPFPDPPPDGIRAGGAPAWRTVITMNIPRVLNGPEELCAQVGCPFSVEPTRLNHASLILTSRASSPAAFQPSDSLLLDVRPVLVPERLPKAPLGPSFLGILGRSVAPEAFGDAPGQQIPITITEFVRGLVDPARADLLPNELALLSLLEPFSIGFGDFDGPGDPGEPVLRLILTASDPVEIR
ncbi:MAG: hypothetical protein JSU98_06225 [Gemmatimonadales bacterium]|nr:MAG: hypothetical protein JSU98_06225 [Gemmatimonadales bacterium]